MEAEAARSRSGTHIFQQADGGYDLLADNNRGTVGPHTEFPGLGYVVFLGRAAILGIMDVGFVQEQNICVKIAQCADLNKRSGRIQDDNPATPLFQRV